MQQKAEKSAKFCLFKMINLTKIACLDLILPISCYFPPVILLVLPQKKWCKLGAKPKGCHFSPIFGRPKCNVSGYKIAWHLILCFKHIQQTKKCCTRLHINHTCSIMHLGYEKMEFVLQNSYFDQKNVFLSIYCYYNAPPKENPPVHPDPSQQVICARL